MPAGPAGVRAGRGGVLVRGGGVRGADGEPAGGGGGEGDARPAPRRRRVRVRGGRGGALPARGAAQGGGQRPGVHEGGGGRLLHRAVAGLSVTCARDGHGRRGRRARALRGVRGRRAALWGGTVARRPPRRLRAQEDRARARRALPRRRGRRARGNAQRPRRRVPEAARTRPWMLPRQGQGHSPHLSLPQTVARRLRARRPPPDAPRRRRGPQRPPARPQTRTQDLDRARRRRPRSVCFVAAVLSTVGDLQTGLPTQRLGVK